MPGPVARRELRRGQAHVAPEAEAQLARRLAGELGEHARERAADLLGDVAVDLLAVEAADVVGLEDLWGRRGRHGRRQDTLPPSACSRPTTTHCPATPAGKGDAKVIVVMPARNAAKTLEATVSRHPQGAGSTRSSWSTTRRPTTPSSSRASCRCTSSGTRTTSATAATRRRATSRRSSATRTSS